VGGGGGGGDAFPRRDGGIHAGMLNGWRGGEEHDAHQEMMRSDAADSGKKTCSDADVERDAKEVGQVAELLTGNRRNFRRPLLWPHWLPTPTNLGRRPEIAQIRKIFTNHRERRAFGRDAGDYCRCFLSPAMTVRETDRQLVMRPLLYSGEDKKPRPARFPGTWWCWRMKPQWKAKLLRN